jgi:hypothetical protein
VGNRSPKTKGVFMSKFVAIIDGQVIKTALTYCAWMVVIPFGTARLIAQNEKTIAYAEKQLARWEAFFSSPDLEDYEDLMGKTRKRIKSLHKENELLAKNGEITWQRSSCHSTEALADTARIRTRSIGARVVRMERID